MSRVSDRLARARENAQRLQRARELEIPKKTSLFMAEHNPQVKTAKSKPGWEIKHQIWTYFQK